MNVLHVFQDDGISGDVWAMRVINNLHLGKRVLVVNEDTENGKFIGIGGSVSEQDDWRFHTFANCKQIDIGINTKCSVLLDLLQEGDFDVVCWNVDILAYTELLTDSQLDLFISMAYSQTHLFSTYQEQRKATLQSEQISILKKLNISRIECSAPRSLKAENLTYYRAMLNTSDTADNVVALPPRYIDLKSNTDHLFDEWAVMTSANTSLIPRHFFSF